MTMMTKFLDWDVTSERLDFETKSMKNDAEYSSRNGILTNFMHLSILALHMGLIFWGIIYVIATPLLCIFETKIGILFLLPQIWIIYDKETPRTGGRRSKWFLRLKLFNTFRDYFPARLVKTADLPAGRNYILAHYPHSLTPFNILPNFLNDANKVSELFPQIEMQFVTHDKLFFIPILRDFALAIGACSCSESSFKYLLNRSPSKGVIVVPGGGAEISYAQPGSVYRIIKTKRKGFVRLALMTGTSLVPVFTFGEINTWNTTVTIPTKWLCKFISRGVPDLFFAIGRGFFTPFGLLPKKVPVNTIVGAPIPVPKVENPSQELIDSYHEQFFDALSDLFEKYKHDYDIAGSKARLIMI